MSRGLPPLVLLLVLLVAKVAAADQKETCATAYEGAQAHRTEGKLVLALAELETCALSCPDVLRKDCLEWREAVESEVPRVRLIVRDARGNALSGAEAFAGASGRRVPADGTAFPMDPGEHSIEVRHGDYSVRRSLTLRRGAEVAEVEFLMPVGASKPHSSEEQGAGGDGEASEGVAPERRRFPTHWTVIGLALGTVGAGLSIAGHVQATHLRKTCAPECQDSERRVVSGLWWAGAASGVVGAATFGVGYAFRF